MEGNVFQKAKAACSLEALFEHEGAPLAERGSSGLRTHRCPSPSCVSGADPWKVSCRDGFWRCWTCGKSGDVVKAAALFWGTDQKSAAQKLAALTWKASREAAPQDTEEAARRQAALQICLERVIDGTGMSAGVRQYLHSRGISDEVIDPAVAQDKLRGLPDHAGEAGELLERLCSRRWLEKAGLWRADSKFPTLGFRPALFLSGRAAVEARDIFSGVASMVHAPKVLRFGTAREAFALEATQDGQTAIITKSPIDVLSLRQLGFNGKLIAMPGDSSWRTADANDFKQSWFAGLKGKVSIALQNTAEGLVQADMLSKALASQGIESHPLRGIRGIDPAAHLMSMIEL